MTYDYFKVFKASIKYSHSIFFAKIKRKCQNNYFKYCCWGRVICPLSSKLICSLNGYNLITCFDFYGTLSRYGPPYDCGSIVV